MPYLLIEDRDCSNFSSVLGSNCLNQDSFSDIPWCLGCYSFCQGITKLCVEFCNGIIKMEFEALYPSGLCELRTLD